MIFAATVSNSWLPTTKMAYRNAPIHPFPRLIYFLLRIIVWFSLPVLYRRRLVLGRENLRFDGPAIVIVNHPSTLLDVLNPAVLIRQEMFFLANYGMFKNPIEGWILRRFFCIPVKRKEDVAEGAARDNMRAFEKSFEHLEKNGVLFIAVEGTSWMNRFVRPLKTGVARIAFGAEARNDWQLDVKIIPIGLSYSAPHLFRSDVVVNVGAPVHVRDWADAWKQNPTQGIADLIGHLETQLKTRSIHTRDEAGEQLITQLEEVLQNEQPLPQKAAFERSQALTKTALDKPELRSKTEHYFEKLKAQNLRDAVVVASRQPSIFRRTIWRGFLLLLGFPGFAVGYVFWFLPCFLPWLLNKKMDIYIGYSTTIKLLAGLITFPIALWVAYKIGWQTFGRPELAWLAVILAILLGFFAEQYSDLFKRFVVSCTAVRLATSRPNLLGELLRLRAAVLRGLTPRP